MIKESLFYGGRIPSGHLLEAYGAKLLPNFIPTSFPEDFWSWRTDGVVVLGNRPIPICFKKLNGDSDSINYGTLEDGLDECLRVYSYGIFDRGLGNPKAIEVYQGTSLPVFVPTTIVPLGTIFDLAKNNLNIIEAVRSCRGRRFDSYSTVLLNMEFFWSSLLDNSQTS